MDRDRLENTPPRMPPEERRRFVRVRKGVRVAYRVLGRPEAPAEETTTINVSIGGLLLPLPETLPLGTHLLLTIVVEPTELEMTLHARVAWVHPVPAAECETGVSFIGMEPAQEQNILALIASDLPQPDGLEPRRFIRLRTALRVSFREQGFLAGSWIQGATRDLSLGGFALESPAEMAAGAALRLRLHLDDGVTAPLEIPGSVVQCDALEDRPGRWLIHGRFRDVSTDAFERLAAYVSRHVLAPPIGPFHERT